MDIDTSSLSPLLHTDHHGQSETMEDTVSKTRATEQHSSFEACLCGCGSSREHCSLPTRPPSRSPVPDPILAQKHRDTSVSIVLRLVEPRLRRLSPPRCTTREPRPETPIDILDLPSEWSSRWSSRKPSPAKFPTSLDSLVKNMTEKPLAWKQRQLPLHPRDAEPSARQHTSAANLHTRASGIEKSKSKWQTCRTHTMQTRSKASKHLSKLLFYLDFIGKRAVPRRSC